MAFIANEEIINTNKAVITTDALAAQGKLNDAQSDRFIDYVVQETVLKDNARMIKFRNENLDIDKIGVGNRAAVPKAEAVDPGVRRGISTSKITLTPQEIMVPFELSDTFLDVNIEGDNVEDHIIKMFGKRLGNNLEELYINGNTLGPATTENDYLGAGSTTKYVKDSYLGMFDGWIDIAEGANIVDAEGQNIGLGIFGKAIRQMPTKFRRNKKQLRWFMSPNLYQLYLEKLSTRVGALGETAANGGTHGPFGIKAVEVPLFEFLPSVTEHIVLTGTTTATDLLNTNVSNVVVVPSDLGANPTDAYVEGTGNDYIVDEAAGTIIRDGASTISSGATVKVTYDSSPQMILTHQDNFIIGIGRDVKIEKDRDIYKGVNQYAITTKVSVNFEELTSIVKVRNIGSGV
jgi:hypothetical protein